MVSSSPVPGRPARGSASGQPFSVLLDLVGRRWALTVLWALRDGPQTFGEIQARDERISNGTLSARLGELCRAGLVGKTGRRGYRLTGHGRALVELGTPLADWSKSWAADLEG